MSEPEQYTLTVSSRPENLSRIADFVHRVAAAWGLNEREAFAVSMAVDEACTNIIEHAYGTDEGPIEIACRREDDDCIIVIRDQGRPFDPFKIPEPDLEAPLEEREVGGLGLFFMRQLMDEVNFHFDPDLGNVLTMVRRGRLVTHRPAHRDPAITVVEVRGRLDAELASRLEEELEAVLESAGHRLLVDMSGVRYIGSSGLRVLLGALKAARRHHGDIKLFALDPAVLEVFRLAGFHHIFDFYESERDAIKALEGDAPVRGSTGKGVQTTNDRAPLSDGQAGVSKGRNG
jgi:anti-anti-sigma factor